MDEPLFEWRERQLAEELLRWAEEMKYFSDEPFVCDAFHGLNVNNTMIDNVAREADKFNGLFTDLRRNERAPLLSGGWRHGGGAQDRRSA